MAKKVNKNYSFGKFDLVALIIIVVTFILSGLFYSSFLNTKKLYNIEKTNIDFTIQAPSKKQVDQISELSHIDMISPYIYFSTNVEINKIKVKTNLYIVESKNDLKYTQFSEELLIRKSDNSYDNPIYVSNEFVESSKIDLDEEIKINIYNTVVTFTVQAIYESDYRQTGGVVLTYLFDELKMLVEDQFGGANYYTGAFIDSNDIVSTTAYLQSYKPLGDLRSREEFDSEELYQLYLDERNKTDYTLTTFYKDKYMKEVSKRNDSKLNRNLILTYSSGVIGCIVFGIMLYTKFYRYYKTEIKKDINNNYSLSQEKTMFGKYYIVLVILSLVFSVCLSFINSVLYSFELISLLNILLSIGIVVTCLIIWAIAVKKINKRFGGN